MNSFTLAKVDLGNDLKAWDEAHPENLGGVEVVKAEISRLYPELQWERSDVGNPEKHHSWYGRFQPDDLFMVQLLVHHDAYVCVISLTMCEAHVAERIAKHFGLVVIDEARFLGA